MSSTDTVIFQAGYPSLDASYWRDVGFSPVKLRPEFRRNDDLTSMTVYPRGRQGKDWLRVQASLPKIVFGDNVKLLTEKQARGAAIWLCEHVSHVTGLTFTVDNVKPFRIDYMRHYEIREEEARTITLALMSKDLIGFNCTNREGDSVWFAMKHGRKVIKAIEVYPKFAWAIETKQSQHVIDESRGKLRLEVRLMQKGLKGIKGATRPLDYLSQSVGDSVLNQAANLLDLQRIINARNIDFQELLLVHAYRHRSLGKLGLMGFAEMVIRHGENFHQKPEFHYARSTYYKHRRELVEMGKWGDLVAASAIQSA
jgi:hypothetical protein